jgi:hypothetical protein
MKRGACLAGCKRCERHFRCELRGVEHFRRICGRPGGVVGHFNREGAMKSVCVGLFGDIRAPSWFGLTEEERVKGDKCNSSYPYFGIYRTRPSEIAMGMVRPRSPVLGWAGWSSEDAVCPWGVCVGVGVGVGEGEGVGTSGLEKLNKSVCDVGSTRSACSPDGPEVGIVLGSVWGSV